MSRGQESAYPAHGSMGEIVAFGLTIREAAAIAAMQGYVANSEGMGSLLDATAGNPSAAARLVAIASVMTADALIAELAKERTP